MFIWCMDPAMPGEDHDTPAMMTFSGAERGSESGRRREDVTVKPHSCEMVQIDW